MAHLRLRDLQGPGLRHPIGHGRGVRVNYGDGTFLFLAVHLRQDHGFGWRRLARTLNVSEAWIRGLVEPWLEGE